MTNYTPESPSYTGSVPVVEATDPITAANNNAPIQRLMDNEAAIKTELDIHKGTSVNSQGGAHGLRYYGESLEYYDDEQEEWVEITTGTTIVQIPTVSVGSYTYNGTAQGPQISGVDTDHVVVTGNPSAINAGTYAVTFALKNAGTMMWTDMTTTDKTYAYTIEKAALAAPAVTDTSKTYTGNAQHPTVTGYDSATMERSGYEYTDAGSYTLAFALSDPSNYEWSDGTTAAKATAWSIAKAAGGATVSVQSITLSEGNESASFTVTGATGTWTAAVLGDADFVAGFAVSVSGNTVTVTADGSVSGEGYVGISIEASANYEAADIGIPLTADFVKIYGAEWDGTAATAWSRTDAAASFTDPVPYVSGASSYSSPFDTLQPWAGMTKDTSDSNAGTLVRIPKFWYKLTQSGNKIKVQIADAAVDGYSVSPAHMDRGDGNGERDVVYVGRYHCGATAYKSVSGQKPKASITRSTARTSIKNLGTGISQMDFAMRFTLWLLYIVEFADWNSQAKIGKGCGNNSATENMGYTDSMPYHTGTTQSSRDTYGLGTQYRNIEGLWDNVYDWMDGCYYNSNGMNIILNPANFSDSSGGTLMGKPSSGYPSKFTVSSAGGFPAFYASEASGGSETTYSCDYWYYGASCPCLFVGGNYDQSGDRGLFFVSYGTASNASAGIGCRLQKLP